MKRNAIENIIPVVVKLKRKLEERKSPVLYELMVFLRELTKEYKNEVNYYLLLKFLLSGLKYEGHLEIHLHCSFR